MKEIWQAKWEELRKKSRPFGIIILGLAGILLLGLSAIFPPVETAGENSAYNSSADLEWVTLQEQKLESLLGQLEGAGKTRVMITLESGEEAVYATDSRTDAAGSQEEHVLLGGGSEGLLETTWMPQVQGVVVLCQGAESPAVERKVTEIVSVLLGVASNRISVAKMC